MALSLIKKEKLKELELERGGAAFVSEKSKVTPHPTIVIGLGGLGGRTLNALKGKFIREIGESNNIYFRMVDTDRLDIKAVCKVRYDGTINESPNANLEQNESILLYDPSIAHMLHDTYLPPNIKKWLNSSLVGTTLDYTGAQQIRQIGRAMLVNDIVYNKVYVQLSTVILDAISKAIAGGDVNVIMIAGVSGGTGSGTIIDMTYMIHNIFKNAGWNNYRIAGYIYTPDVQFAMTQIASNLAIKQNLMKNGYAALKEIDYFMNIVETNSEYRLELGNKSIISSKNIFDSCTLISGYRGDGSINEVALTIERLTDHLIDMVTDISIVQGGNSAQMSSCIFSSPHSVLQQAWFVEHQDRRIHHRYATYKYQVLGYNSIVIPRDEIIAYCVNKIYQRVLTEFKNLSKVNRDMLKEVFNRTNTLNPDVFTMYAVLVVNPNNPIERGISLDDGYTKRMISNNNRIAYDDACQVAAAQKIKINGRYQVQLENALYEALKAQVDRIFAKHGPYMAFKTIEHRSEDLSVGNPYEPFPGVIEQLVKLSNVFLNRANDAANAYNNGGAEQIRDAALNACSGIFTKRDAIRSYVDTCCEMAVTTQIDSMLFRVLADVLSNVASRMNDYNSEMFDVYTSILSEVQDLLNRDGQYFSKGNNEKTSIDLIKLGKPQTEQLKKYLDDLIFTVDVDALSCNFINKMKNDKEKWLAQTNDNDFDVVNEVRQLMDECLTSNKIKDDIVEKFVAIAYSPTEFTPEQWEEIWEDNSQESPKMRALQNAADVIYPILMYHMQNMTQSSGRIPFETYPNQIFMSVLKDTPRLSAILTNMFQVHAGCVAVSSNSNNKFMITQQYMNVPMYVFKGMNEYDMTYNEHPSAGRHMDEQTQNWGRFPNPYTIDSVATDISESGRPKQDIKRWCDYQILLDIYTKTLDGINKYKFIEIKQFELGWTRMFLYDITSKPENMDAFKEQLYKALRKNFNIDIVKFMEENGFIINPVEVRIGQTDIELALIDFGDGNVDDLKGMYKDIPVQIPDVFKWLRKSIKYMDIINNSTAIFEDFWDVVEAAMQ